MLVIFIKVKLESNHVKWFVFIKAGHGAHNQDTNFLFVVYCEG